MPQSRLFFGIMYRERELCDATLATIITRYGPVVADSGEFAFDFTTNYEHEFGQGLQKRFVVFHRLIDRAELPTIKNYCVELERKHTSEGKRRINIDPGYVTLNNVIVASTKDHPHRVYLQDGIYGDVQLILRKDGAHTLEHTYPDYARYKEFFMEQRGSLLASMRDMPPRDKHRD